MPDRQPICTHVMAERYAAPGEVLASQIYTRVAHALAQAEAPAQRPLIAQEFLRNMEMGAIGAGRIMANAGTHAYATMINCFVQPVGVGTPLLAFDTGLEEAGLTLAMGGGVGYDFSALPPSSASAEAKASTPTVCAAIDRYDAACANLSFQGSRRGAQMAVLSCNHPDILEFIRAKHGRKRWRTFNISVAVTDAFLAAVQRDAPWPLMHCTPPDERSISRGALQLDNGLWRYRWEPARKLWAAIAAEATHSSEPGLLYIDTVNRTNNLRTIETLRATNPCGEQPLPDYGCCVLGPINLTRLVKHPFGIGGKPEIDIERLGKMVRTQVRMLDNVIDLTCWPLPAQAKEAFSKRRIGVGITGLADMLAMMQLRYASEAGRLAARSVARCIRDNAYAASAELAAERAPFPLYRLGDYLSDGAIGDFLAPDVVKAIKAHGLRNSHLISFAPTGSVSLAFADGCSSGIEPAFDWVYRRRIQSHDGDSIEMTVENHAWRLWKQSHVADLPLPRYFQKGTDIAPEDHLAMMAALQPYVDASISKTVPVPNDYRPERAQALFVLAWQMGLKGITIFRPDKDLTSVISAASGASASMCVAQRCGSCG